MSTLTAPMRGVLLDLATLSRNDLDLAPLHNSLDELTVYDASPVESVAARVADAEVILTNKVRLDAQVIGAARKARLIALAATGHNNVDLEAARAAGIAVTNIRDYCTAAVAEHVFALILSLNQHLVEYVRAVRAGAWSQGPHFCLLDWPIRELAGRTLGIVGYGTLGRAVAQRAEAFGMRVLVARRPGIADDRPERVALDRLLAEADVLSLHCPLTDATRQLIDASALARMKPGAILVNTARGAIVDSQAVVDALRDGHLGGAGMDVLPEEPPLRGDPLLELDDPRLIVTPHIAWASIQARQRAVEAMAGNIRAFRQGRPLNLL